MNQDSLQIFLHNIAVLLRVGYYAAEEAAPQMVIISLDVTVAALPDYHAIGRDLSQLVDYGAIHHFLTQDLPQQPHQAFLEAIAETIMAYCFNDQRVQQVRVKLQKPDIIPNAPEIGIMLVRTRKIIDN